MERIKRAKLGALCGASASIVFLIMYYEATRLDPGYVFGRNYLSDLGVSPGAWAFNSGVIAAGALEIAFAVLGWYPAVGKGTLQKASGILLALAGVFLISIGILTEDFDPEHLIVSVSFFMTMLIFLGLSTAMLWRTRVLGRLGATVTTVAFLLGIALLPLGFVPSSETVAVLALNAWGLVVSVLIITRES